MKFLSFWCLGLCLGLTALRASPVQPTALPPGPSLLGPGESFGAFHLQLAPEAADAATLQVVPADGPGFTRAWEIATRRDTAPMDAIELRALNARPVAEGDVALLRFFARAVTASDESGQGRIMIVVRKNGVDFNSSYEGDFNFGPEWQEVLIPFVFAKDFPVDGAAIMLRFGFKRQTLELGGLEVIHYGKSQAYASLPRTRFTYAGREPGAPWRQAALARIAQLRQSDFSLRLTDAAGRPVTGARLTVTQQRTAFQWGSALKMERLVQDSPDNTIYRQKVLELFNEASTENDLKWPVWLGEWEGNYSQTQTLAGLHWLRDHGFYTRGHVLVWPGRKNLPKAIQSRLGTPQDVGIPALVDAHIREMLQATKGLVDEWDVLNEPFTNHDLMDRFGPEIMPPWFQLARKEFPAGGLFFNDFRNDDATTDPDHVAHFERTTKYLLEHGAPVTGLGLQAHFGGRPGDPEHILAVLDRYENEFHLPVRMTEFDVWTFDEQLQADFTRDFMILCYSHPSVVGVQFWGFWAGAHWRPPAAMFRQDWSERPVAQVYRDLVLKQWRTNLNGTSDPAGAFSGRGYHGDYLLTVEYQGKSVPFPFRLSPQSPQQDFAFRLP